MEKKVDTDGMTREERRRHDDLVANQAARDALFRREAQRKQFWGNNVDEPDVDEPDVDEPDVDEPDVDEPDVDEPVEKGAAMSAEKMNDLARFIERVVPESCCGDDAVDRRNIARTVAFELERRAEDVCRHLVSAARRNEDAPPPWESQP